MKKIAHISDLHFGKVDKAAEEAIISEMAAVKPELIVISGDLTQRARSGQYEAARAFLDKLKSPQIVIPGNHDISLHNVWKRFVRPLKYFSRIINPDYFPRHEGAGIFAVGVNTARSFTWKSGKVSGWQLKKLDKILGKAGKAKIKCVAAHHNAIVNLVGRKYSALKNADEFFSLLKKHNVDILMAGHVHNSYAALAGEHNKFAGPIILSSAGTAISKRTRGGANEYNLIEAGPKNVNVIIKRFHEGEFRERKRWKFHKSGGNWANASPPA